MSFWLVPMMLMNFAISVAAVFASRSVVELPRSIMVFVKASMFSVSMPS